ncbi:MFS transporter [Salaquimonas pukyongi]|uniref:MFS transporter n=1 Tax=Salaquimonas pukyongi TaxID=2712698 RepID=UPI00096B82BF|nr:MFS transporter [Salaquimonas pukyongi]
MAGIVVLLFSYVLSQFYRSFLAVLAPKLGSDLGASATELSNAAAAWFIVFALMQFPIGAWLDRAGPRRTAGFLFLAGSGGGITLFALAQSPVMLIVAMGMIGMGCAPVLMATFYFFARTYSEASFATLAAVFVGLGTLGNVAGTEPLAAAVEAFGWRQVGFGLAAFTFAVGIGILAFVKDPPKAESSGKDATIFGGLADLFRIRELWFIFPMVAMGYGVAASIRGLWAGPFLHDMYGLTTGEIGRVTLYMALALAGGSLAYGPLDRLFNSRKWVVLIGNLLVLAAIAYMIAADMPSVWMVTVMFVAIGFFGAGYATQMAHGKAFVPAHLTGRGVTLLNFFSIGGVGVSQAVSGYVVDIATRAGGKAAGYESLFVFYAVMLVVALAIYAFSTDAKPQSG